MGLTVFALISKYLASLPAQAPYLWADLEERHQVPWKRLVLALIGLEVVLLLLIRLFGNGHEQVEPYAGWLAPFGEALVHAVPKFTLMAGKLVEMGLPERINVVVAAWAVAYAAQIALAAIWAPPIWRRLRQRPPPPGAAHASRPSTTLIRVTSILLAIILVGLVVLHPEAGEVQGSRQLFQDFESRDVHLLYTVVFHSTLYWQLTILCLLYAIAYGRAHRLARAAAQPVDREGGIAAPDYPD